MQEGQFSADERLERSAHGGHTRSAFLRRAAVGSGAIVGGGALLGAPAAFATTKSDTANDIKFLNYALTLEHLEATFYVEGLKRFNSRALKRTTQLKKAGAKQRETVGARFALIRDHEVTHVKTLQTVIKSLGGTPVPPAVYNFDKTAFTSADQFVATAAVLENTGVMAYDGAIAYIISQALQTAGATIATVEARHASYLNLVNGEVPFPDAFDTPKAPREIALLVAKTFIVSAPFDLAGFAASLPDKVIAP